MSALAVAAPEPDEAPRFQPARCFGIETVHDTALDRVVVHQAPWDENMAAFVAAELNEQARRAALFTWESRL